MLSLLLTLAVAAVGCGSEPEVKAAVERVAGGLADRDGQRACKSLTNKAQFEVAALKPVPLSCSKVVESLPADTFSDCRGVEVGKVRFPADGEARVRVSRPQGEVDVSLTNKQGSRWKVRTLPCGPKTQRGR